MYHVFLCINIYQLLRNDALKLGSCHRQIFILHARCERLACGCLYQDDDQMLPASLFETPWPLPKFSLVYVHA